MLGMPDCLIFSSSRYNVVSHSGISPITDEPEHLFIILSLLIGVPVLCLVEIFCRFLLDCLAFLISCQLYVLGNCLLGICAV